MSRIDLTIKSYEVAGGKGYAAIVNGTEAWFLTFEELITFLGHFGVKVDFQEFKGEAN